MARVSVCHILEATAGGTRKHLDLLLGSLDRDKFDLSCVVSPNREPGFAADLERFRSLGVRVETVSMRREISPLADWRSYRGVKRALRTVSPQIVHTHGSKGGFFGRLAARAVGVGSVVHTPHVFAFQWNAGLKGRFYRALERYAARRCDRIIALSESQKRLTVEAGLLPPERVEVIANGVDPAAYPSAHPAGEIRSRLGLGAEGPIVVMVARLMPQKGCRNFIRAAALVLAELPEIRFCLIGDGPMEEELRAEVGRLGIEGNFQLAGHVERASDTYTAFDLFVLSSLWEGMPYAELEAMASRLAVIATRIPGTVDLVTEGETGHLVTPDSTEEIASRIVELMRDDALRRRMGEAGRRRVEEEFTLGRFTRAHEELYAKLASG